MPDKQERKRDASGRFKPGCSGNPNGRPKSKTLSEAYRAALKLPLPDDPTRTYADAVAETLCKNAVAGDVGAARELADRTEGKPRQSVDITLDERKRSIFEAGVQALVATGLSEEEAENYLTSEWVN